MPQFMLLLHRSEAAAAGRNGEASLWADLNEAAGEAGVLAGSGRLHPADTATTVRVRDGLADLTDGPFAVTKEELAGLSTAATHGLGFFEALVMLTEGRPWMPAPG